MARLIDKNINVIESLVGRAIAADFIPEEFDGLVSSQGYNVIWEKSLRCPCKDRDSDHLSICGNCGGTGFLFVNPVSTKAVLTSISHNKGYEEHGEIDYGMVNVTFDRVIKPTRMDRITVVDGESVHSEVFYPAIDEDDTGQYFNILHYHVKSIEWVGLFEDPSSKIRMLEEGEDFYISNNIIVLDEKFNSLLEPQLSIRYIHYPQFHIWDMMNDIRSAKTDGVGGSRDNNVMVTRAVAKRAHLILDVENFDGDRLFDNSWDMSCTTTNESSDDKFEQIITYTSVEKIFETLTTLQKVQIKPFFGRVIDSPGSFSINILAPTVVII